MSLPLKVESSIQGKDLQHGQHMLTKQKTASQAGLSTFRDCFFRHLQKGAQGDAVVQPGTLAFFLNLPPKARLFLVCLIRSFEAVNVLLQEKPDWDTAKKVLNRPTFLQDLKSYDKDRKLFLQLWRVACCFACVVTNWVSL